MITCIPTFPQGGRSIILLILSPLGEMKEEVLLIKNYLMLFKNIENVWESGTNLPDILADIR